MGIVRAWKVSALLGCASATREAVVSVCQIGRAARAEGDSALGVSGAEETECGDTAEEDVGDVDEEADDGEGRRSFAAAIWESREARRRRRSWAG